MASADKHLNTVDGVYVSWYSAGLVLTVGGIVDFENKIFFFNRQVPEVMSVEAPCRSWHEDSIFSLPRQSNFHQSHKFSLRLITLDSSPQSIPNPLLSISEYFLLMLLTHLLMQLNVLLHGQKTFILHFVLHPVIHQFLLLV